MNHQTNGEILDQIDATMDELDRLIHKLTVPNKKELSQQVYDLFAKIEQRVEDNF